MAKAWMSQISLYTFTVTVFLVFSLCYNGVHCATHGEKCGSDNLCDGFTLQCWGTVCMCAVGYEHVDGSDVCQEKVDVLIPDYLFSNIIEFNTTDITEADLDSEKKNRIKIELEEQLHPLFKGVVGFKDVTVTSVTITKGNLQAVWVVTLDGESPGFANLTRKEANTLIGKDLEDVNKRFTNTNFFLDLSERESGDKADHEDDTLWIGLGIGLGCLVLVIIVIIIVGVVLLRKRGARRDLTGAVVKKSTIGAPTISSKGGSSQLDGDDYQYSVFKKDGFKTPTYFSHPAPPSEASSFYAVIDDKRPLQ